MLRQLAVDATGTDSTVDIADQALALIDVA
jgi:hypothetical protein